MIYVSSACLKNTKIKHTVEKLAEYGFKNIELSGGTSYYDGYEIDLIDLREKYGLTYLIHNYFPPPNKDFVLNLASLNGDIFEKSLNHYKNALDLATALGINKFGFHAGSFIEIPVSELGNNLSALPIADRSKAFNQFCRGFQKIKEYNNAIELYLENHVLSYPNAQAYPNQNSLMLTKYDEYLELKKMLDFKLLLDVGHLYVSTHSLNLDFDYELRACLNVSDYIHISGNDGFHDQNLGFAKNSSLLASLSQHDISNKIIVLEIYDSLTKIHESFNIIQNMI